MVLDPFPRWTDGVPLPVLGISLTFGMWGVATCISAIFGQLPQFGTMLVGVAAAAVLLIEGVIELLIAWATFRRSAASWWAALSCAIFYAIATGIDRRFAPTRSSFIVERDTRSSSSSN